MHEIKKFSLDEVITNREIDTTGLSVLRQNLKAHGQKVPVLLTDENILIDGQRRLEALRQLGRGYIWVALTNDLENSLKVLHTAHVTNTTEAKDITPRRVYEIYQGLMPQVDKRTAALRRRRLGISRDHKLEPLKGARALISDALGVLEGYTATSMLLYKRFSEPCDPDIQMSLSVIRARLEGGEITLYEARGQVSRAVEGVPPPESLSPVDAGQQREALRVAHGQLTGTIKGLEYIGRLSPDITDAEVDMYIQALSEAKRSLHRFIGTTLKNRN